MDALVPQYLSFKDATVYAIFGLKVTQNVTSPEELLVHFNGMLLNEDTPKITLPKEAVLRIATRKSQITRSRPFPLHSQAHQQGAR